MKIKDDEINLAAKYLYDNQEVLLEHYIYSVQPVLKVCRIFVIKYFIPA